MQVHVEHQGAGILSVNLQLLHGLNGSVIDVEELVIDHTMQ